MIPARSRRAFLQLAAGAALGCLAACGGSASSAPSASNAAPASTGAVGSTPATVAASPASAAGSAPPSSVGSIKIAYPTTGASYSPVWMAVESHAFVDQGVNANVTYVQGNAVYAALASKDVDLIEISPDPIINADINSNSDMVYLASFSSQATWSLYVDKSIQSAADLKGKKLAAYLPGDPSDFGMRAALKLLGLQASDVSMVSLGTTEARSAALYNGQVSGALMSPPETFRAASQGFHDLQDTYSVPHEGVGLVMLRSRMAEFANVMPRVVVAFRNGMQWFNTHPTEAKAVLKKYTKESDDTIIQKTYDFFINQTPFKLDMQPSIPAIQAEMDYLGDTVTPAAKNHKPEEFIDTRFLSALAKN